MFGYVTPCKMELKIKDYEKFKSYYCGLCMAIKKNFGNIPRLTLNYDMTFLAILLDSLEERSGHFVKQRCIMHPIKEKVVLVDSKALDYAAFLNIILVYYNFIDDVQDDNSVKGKFASFFLKPYIKNLPEDFNLKSKYIQSNLDDLNNYEKDPLNKSIDEITHPFADITGYIISNYIPDFKYKNELYWLGYNLGKWIYIIDAWDDLEKDMKENKFNPINCSFNKQNLNYYEFSNEIKTRIDFILVTSSRQCLEFSNKIPLMYNGDLIQNILQFGLLQKMDKLKIGVNQINE